MQPWQPADVIFAGPQTARSRVAWLAVVILAAALIGVLLLALHYRQEAAMLHRHLRSVISSDMVVLPPSGRLAGEVTFFAVRSPAGQARVVVTARITGGRPHSQYELFGGDCAFSAADHAWAMGATDSRGSADIAGRAWTVSPGHEYYLVVGSPLPDRQSPGPAVHGYFGLARGVAAVPPGIAPCAP